jgi:hypothetical protein
MAAYAASLFLGLSAYAGSPAPVSAPAPAPDTAAAAGNPSAIVADSSSAPPDFPDSSASVPALSTPRNPADTLSKQERFLNTVTGSHQKASPSPWRGHGPYPGAPLLLTLPAADFPYALRGGFDSPSMRQSQMATAGLTQWADQSIAWLWSGAESAFLRNVGTYASLGFYTWFSTYMPLGDAWLHEEWHRAVLTRRGIGSYNGIYHWNLGSDVIAVDHVTDRDLATLKDGHPAEFTRLMEAGGEGEIESVRLMRRRDFFLGRPAWPDRIGWWTSGLDVSVYIWICSGSDYDYSLRDANAKEADPGQRDFTGLDFRAWVHDLRHPDESYASGPRGRTHPSGTGFDRYLMDGDLTADERGFLKLQAGLSLLNLVSGQHLGWDWMPGINPWGGQGYLWNFGLTHHLTPFGYALGGEFLARQGKADWVFTAQGMASAGLVLPCLGAELFRYPLALGREPVFLSFSVLAWLQPEAQRFRADAAAPGAYGLLGAAFPLSQNLEIFAEADAKTAGWVQGVVYLDPAAEGRVGLQVRL